jgi:hypothetical protein
MGFGEEFVHQLYFAVDETPAITPEDPDPVVKLRACLSATECGNNAATRLLERAPMAGLDGAVNVLHSALRCHEEAILKLYKADWKGGFKQLGVHSQLRHRQCFFLRAPYDIPEKGILKDKIYGFCLIALGFGPRATPNCFCEAPRFIVQVGEVWLGLLLESHMDDVFGSTTAEMGDSEYQLLVELHELFGFELAPESAGAAKRMKPSTEGDILGGHFVICTPDERKSSDILLRLSLPEQKRIKYEQSMLNHIQKESLSSGSAKKLAGRMEFTGSVAWGKRGRPFLKPIYDRAHERATQLTTALRWSFMGLRAMIETRQSQVVLREGVKRTHRVMFTDARGKGEPWGTEALGSLLLPVQGNHHQSARYTSAAVDKNLEKMLPADRQQRINEAEALAVLQGILSHKHSLREVDLTVYIDSSAAMGAIRKCYSQSQFLAAIAGEIYLLCEHLSIRLWLSQIPSKLNPADGLSRLDLTEAIKYGWVRQKVQSVRWTTFQPPHPSA